MTPFATLSDHQLRIAIEYLQRELAKLDRSATLGAAELGLHYQQELDSVLDELERRRRAEAAA